MSSNAVDQPQIVADAIKEISNIATLPEITVKIIELVEDPTSTAQDLHNVISNDPALCSRILKVVNSSFYGLPGQIGSINRAIVLLGLNAVKNIAISASLSKLFRGGELSPNFSARNLWMHAVATATAAKMIAEKLKVGVSDEAFLAGLTHDIGIMVEMQADRNKLLAVLTEITVDADGAPHQDMLELETKHFGANHQQFGKGLCEKWKFPQSFARVCGYHHNPLDLPSGERNMACIVHVADKLAGPLEEGFRLDYTDLDIDGSVLEEIGLSRDAVAEIAENLQEQVDDVAVLLS